MITNEQRAKALTTEALYEACELVKEYRIAFKSGNVWYRRGDK